MRVIVPVNDNILASAPRSVKPNLAVLYQYSLDFMVILVQFGQIITCFPDDHLSMIQIIWYTEFNPVIVNEAISLNRL
jgi:hypothetical protein